MKFFLLIFFLIIIFPVAAQRQKIDPISIGNIKLAEERMKINLELFQIHFNGCVLIRCYCSHVP